MIITNFEAIWNKLYSKGKAYLLSPALLNIA